MKEKLDAIWLLLCLIVKLIANYFKLNEDFSNNSLICTNISKETIKSANIQLTVIGKRNVEDIDAPCLIASNHRSFFDIILLIAAFGRAIPFAAAKKLYSYPVLKKYIKSVNCVSVNPYAADVSEVKRQLKQIHTHLSKYSLVLFPEGECSYENSQIKEFKKGGFFSVNKTETYIIPTYIHVEKFKRIGRWFVPVGNVAVVFGEAFKSNQISGNKITSAGLAEYTQEKVNELKNSFIDKTGNNSL